MGEVPLYERIKPFPLVFRLYSSARCVAQLKRPSLDVRLHVLGKGNSNSHGARPVHLIITVIEWIRTSRLSIKNSLCRSTEKAQSRTSQLRGRLCRDEK